MRILEAVSTTGANGAVRYAGWIIPQLVARGHEVILATLPGAWIADELRGQVEIIETRFDRWPLDQLKRFSKLYRTREIDLVHSHLTRANNFCALLHGVFGVCNVAHAHENGFKAHYWFHDRMIAVSEDTLRQHRRYGAGLRGKGTVLLNFVDSTKFRPLENKTGPDPLRALIQAGADDPVLIQVGQISKRKGQAISLRAMPEIWKAYPRARLVFAGHGQPLPCSDERVHWLGRREDIGELLPWATVALQPSLDEPFGFAALEAMASGVAVVASSVGGAMEVVTDKTGILVPARSPEALAKAILRLIPDADLRAEFGRNGRIRAVESFALPEHMDQLERLLQNVVDLKR